jgi:hypothetical protein
MSGLVLQNGSLLQVCYTFAIVQFLT